MRRKAAVGALLAVMLLALTLRAVFRPAPGDFHNQRTAARAFLASFRPSAEPGERLYDWMEFQRWSDRDGNAGQFGTYVPQPPAALLPYTLVAGLPLATGKVIFALASLVLFAASCVPLGRAMRATGFEVIVALAAIGGALHANLHSGQEMLLVAALLNVTLERHLRGRGAAEGAALGAALALKLFGLPWLLFVAGRRRWRAAAVATGVAIALTLAVALGFGREMLARYVVEVLPASLSGSFHNLYHPSNQSIDTILRRLFLPHPDWNPEPPFPSPRLYGFLDRALPVGLLGLALAAAIGVAAADAALAYSLLLVASLLAAPAVNRYHLAPLFPALLVVMTRARGSFFRIAVALGATGYACFTSQRIPVALQEPRIVGLVLLFGVLLYEARAMRLLPIAAGAAIASGLLLPVDRGAAPASWRRVTAVPFEPLLARCPDRHGEALEIHYAPLAGGGTAFSWDGFAWDSTEDGANRVYERLDGDGRSAIAFSGREGVALTLIAMPDADCRRPRFVDGSHVRFDLEQGPLSTPFIIGLGEASARRAPPDDVPRSRLSDSPDSSPDGKRTAFVVRAGRFTEIRERGPDGAERTLVPPVATSVDPRYSWDGRSLYFASDAGRCAGCTVIYRIELP